MRLLAALEMFAPLANALLAFQNQVRKLVAQLLSEKFEQRDPENEIDFNVLVVLGIRQRALQ